VTSPQFSWNCGISSHIHPYSNFQFRQPLTIQVKATTFFNTYEQKVEEAEPGIIAFYAHIHFNLEFDLRVRLVGRIQLDSP